MKNTHRDIDYVVPGFSDPKVQPQILLALREYAKDMGFSDQEILNIRDRRILLAVYKAMMFDRMVQAEANK